MRLSLASGESGERFDGDVAGGTRELYVLASAVAVVLSGLHPRVEASQPTRSRALFSPPGA